MATFPYFPHTGEDIRRMLEVAGVSSLEELYADVPEEFIYKGDYDLPEMDSWCGVREQQVREYIEGLSASNNRLSVMVGQGAYDHYVPSVIPYITSRSEFLTAYTPYQCEISQGTLRYIFEWQSMICRLTGLDCTNASMYDGPTSAAEAVRMCVNAAKKRKSVIVSARLLPHVLKTIKTYAKYSGINVVVSENVVEDVAEGVLDLAGVLVPSIDRYGVICDCTGLADLVHSQGALLAMYCDPSALAVVRTPAEWGADIAAGDAQTLGIPLNFGGPYVGFLACTSKLMRQLPGRIVGQTEDAEGRRCFVLTLQAREQHIRREKATSNICSNQSLMALWATVYVALMGPEGLRRVNELCYEHSHYLHDELLKTGLFEEVYDQDFLKEFVLKPVKHDPMQITDWLADNASVFGALPTEEGYVTFCATEKHGREEIDMVVNVLKLLAA